MRYSISKFLFTILCLSTMVTAQSQSIDTTKVYIITNMVAGEKLAITGVVSATSGTSVRLRTSSKHAMQQWMMQKTQGGYKLYCLEYGRNYALEVVNEGSKSKKISLGQTVQGASNQVWKVNINPDGSYRLVSLWQEKAIDYIKSGTQENQLTLAEIESNKSQTWMLTGKSKPRPVVPTAVTHDKPPPIYTSLETHPIFDAAADYQIMTNEVPDKSLGIGTLDGRIEQAMIVPARTNPVKEWKILHVGNGLYQITNKRENLKSLEVRKDGVDNEIVMVASTRNVVEQYWKIVRAPDGNFQITSAAQDGSKTFDFVEDDEVRHEIRMRGFNSTLWSIISLTPKTTTTPPVEAVATATPVNKNKLMPGEQLKVDQKIFSANGAFSLVQQTDGNLVVYDSENKATWSSGLQGQIARRCIMQVDGNFTQHPDGYNQIMWSTNTKGNKGAYVLLQDDGVLAVVNTNNEIIWKSMASKSADEPAVDAEQPVASSAVNDRLVSGQELLPSQFITSANGKYKLIQQEDGNLVIYQGNRPIWSTATNGRKTQRCVMQKDGNLVLYDIFRDAIWSSSTHGNENAYLVLQDDGDLVIYNNTGSKLWGSNTGER